MNLNGTIYRQVNTASTLYSISSCHAPGHKGSLVDRGANRGIAGDDVRIIAKTDRSVNIQGIDNHRINKIPIVTAGGVINTQKGPAIASMLTLERASPSIHLHSLKHTSKQCMTSLPK